MFENIREDIKRGRLRNHSTLLHPGTQAVLVYRFGHWAWNLRIPLLRELLLAFYYPLCYLVRTLNGVCIPTRAEIGPGLVIHTWGGVFLPPRRIGRNAVFQHQVYVHPECREIGDNVFFGPGCKIVEPVRIGSRVRIGANAVVTEDIPDDCTVAGVPARIVWSEKWKQPAAPDSRPQQTQNREGSPEAQLHAPGLRR